MAEPTWYVRDKGRVMGPFDDSQMERMRVAGRLTRGSEVSRDQRTWVAASSLATAVGVEPVREAIHAETGTGAGRAAMSGELASATPPTWYYARGKERVGPVSLPDIRQLIAVGTLSADTHVWNPAMPDWKPASVVPELRSLFGNENSHPVGEVNLVVEEEREAARPSKRRVRGRAGFFDLAFRRYHMGWIIPVIWTVTLLWLLFVLLNMLATAFFPRALQGFWADFVDMQRSWSTETRQIVATLIVTMFVAYFGLVVRAWLEHWHIQLSLARKLKVVDDHDEVTS